MADDLTIPKLRTPEYPEIHPRKYLTPKLKAQLALKQNGLCALCGCKPRAFEWDHIQELWAGGTNAIENWQGLCRKCHTDKSGAEAKHRAKMNRCRGKAGQVARRKANGSKLKSNRKIQSRGFNFKAQNSLLSPTEERRSEDPGKWQMKKKWPSRSFGSARNKMVKHDR